MALHYYFCLMFIALNKIHSWHVENQAFGHDSVSGSSLTNMDRVYGHAPPSLILTFVQR